MANVWIRAKRRAHAAKMHYAEFRSIVLFVCVRTAIVVNPLEDAQDQSAPSIVTVKLINNVKAVHAEIHAYRLAHAA